jgi:hypothetical protein
MARVQMRRPTATLRRLPEFVVVGAQRSGTSSMFRYLSAHPEVRRPLRKEIDYFSAHYGRPESWYQAHFPIRRGARSFDCTPQYFVHPLAPERCRATLPDAKIVIMVRDPIARLMSQFSHMRGAGFETMDLPQALAAESARIAPDLHALNDDPAWRPRTFFRFNYLTRSRYGDQFERWLLSYPREAFHIVDFDNFVRAPHDEWDELLAFLGLRTWTPPDFRNWSTPTLKPVMDVALRERIDDDLKEDTERFAMLAGRPLSWVGRPGSEPR